MLCTVGLQWNGKGQTATSSPRSVECSEWTVDVEAANLDTEKEADESGLAESAMASGMRSDCPRSSGAHEG